MYSNLFIYWIRVKIIFPPTLLYNEGWLLRSVLNWLVNNKDNRVIKTMANTHWYSEALLSSAFLPRKRGDTLAESYTHADGVIGHFIIENNGFGDVKLLDDCEQFIVLTVVLSELLSEPFPNFIFKSF